MSWDVSNRVEDYLELGPNCPSEEELREMNHGYEPTCNCCPEFAEGCGYATSEPALVHIQSVPWQASFGALPTA